MLENVHPEWKWPCKMKKQTFDDWVNELKSWVEQHHRFPKRRSEYANESRLEMWLYRLKRKQNMLSPDQIKLLEDSIPGWSDNDEMG
jgi:hypothetical protein